MTPSSAFSVEIHRLLLLKANLNLKAHRLGSLENSQIREKWVGTISFHGRKLIGGRRPYLRKCCWCLK